MKLTLFILIAALSCSRVGATNYYLSDKGNDNHDGKSRGTAWCSLKKLSEVMQLVQPGDSILFERGSIFIGQLGISRSGIFLGAYGSGLKPVISGSIEISKWVSLGKNIWRAECTSCVKEPGNLFLDGKFQPLGRYPNKGYLTLSGSLQSETSISDSNLKFADGYWNNAEVVVRSSRWTIDNLPTTNYSHKTFTTNIPASYLLQNGFGYFIQKHLATLDQPGEWFFKSTTKQIFLYLTPGAKPTDHTIEVSVHDVGLTALNVHNIIINNLTFQHHRIAGVSVKECSAIKFQSIDIFNSGKNGLEVINCKNPRVENSLISDSNNNGVEWHNNIGGVLTHTSILRTGLHAGRGVSGNGTYIALNIPSGNSQAVNNLFEYNTIDSTGYSGIDFRTGNTHIKNNLVTNFCLTKDDGAGVYTWNNTLRDNIIEGNTIVKGIGSGEGAVNSAQLFASGIYIDDRSSHVLIKNNTVSHCSTSGIFLHNAKAITLVGNILFANGYNIANKERGQLYIKLDTLGQLAGKIALHLEVMQNKWVATNDASYCVYLSADKKQDLRQLGAFTQNQYSASHAYQAIAEFYGQPGLCSAPENYTLAEWQDAFHFENGSTFKILPPQRHSDIALKNMISNGSMTLNTEGWMIWPAQSTLSQEKKKIIEGASLKVNVPSGNGNSEALLYHQGFALSKRKLYRLSFSAMSAKPIKIEFAPLMANSPWQALGDYTCFSVDSTYKTFTYFFRPDKTSTEARVNFKSNATFWIDNVSLHEMVENNLDESVKLVLQKDQNH